MVSYLTVVAFSGESPNLFLFCASEKDSLGRSWLLWASLSIQQLIYIDGVVKKNKIYIFRRGEHKSNDALTNDEDSLITKLSIGLSSCNEGGSNIIRNVKMKPVECQFLTATFICRPCVA